LSTCWANLGTGGPPYRRAAHPVRLSVAAVQVSARIQRMFKVKIHVQPSLTGVYFPLLGVAWDVAPREPRPRLAGSQR